MKLPAFERHRAEYLDDTAFGQLQLARISHQGVDTLAKGIDEDIRKEDRLN